MQNMQNSTKGDCPLLYYFVDDVTKMAQIIAKRVTLHFGTDFACRLTVVINRNTA